MFSRRPVLVVRFFLLLFSGVLLLDFMALHMRRVSVCKFAGSRFALVVLFLRCRGLVSNWMFTGESIHQ